MPSIHLKAKAKSSKEAQAGGVVLRCPWPTCSYEWTVPAAEARKIKLCPNCIKPLRGKRRGPEVGDLARLASILPPQLRRQAQGPTPLEIRLMEAAEAERDERAYPLYMHTVFCQTSMPYRDPGDEVRTWRRVNGNIVLNMKAGEITDPDTLEDIPLNLPFGPKARTILMHINQRAILSKSSAVEMGDSLTHFVRRVLEIDPKGRNMRMVKEQLARLSASRMRLTVITDGHPFEIKTDIVEAFDLWFPKDERQRVLWPSFVQLSDKYFESLRAHAVPLDEAHIAALCHSSMALDIYSWLAQRLHRIPKGKPALVSWNALHTQFGAEIGELFNFRRIFRVALKEVLTVYRAAHVEEDERGPRTRYREGGRLIVREPALQGLTLFNSPSPVPRRSLLLSKPVQKPVK